MKIARVFEIEAALTRVIQSTTERSKIKELRSARNVCKKITDAERETLTAPKSVQEFDRVLREWQNELNAMEAPQRLAKLTELRDEFPTAREDAIAWKRLTDETMNEDAEIQFTPIPSSHFFKNDKCTVSGGDYDTMCEGGVIEEGA